jgi:hypothetical protein
MKASRFHMTRLFLMLLLASVPLAAYAEIIPTLPDSLEVVVIPETPTPGEMVIVRAANYSGNPANTRYVWTVNGKVAAEGFGATQVSFTAGALGVGTRVTVTATENGVTRGTRVLTVTPADVDVVWEGNTETPPFYIGLPLPNGSSHITAVAMPHIFRNGTRIPAADLVYEWTVNGSSKLALAGYGRTAFTTAPPQFLNTFSISVRVATREGDVAARRTITIRPTQPEVVVYERAPLLGMRFDRAIPGTVSLAGGEATFVAYPMYANAALSSAYRWTVDGNPVEATGASPREITFRKSGEGRGRFSIQFSLEDASRLFNRAKDSFTVTF